MPTLIFTMPFPNPPTWNGRLDAGGGAADGILIETSHVSILGLRFLGLPVLEGPRPGIERRLYGINRSSRELEDLEIGHCMFLATRSFTMGCRWRPSAGAAIWVQLENEYANA